MFRHLHDRLHHSLEGVSSGRHGGLPQLGELCREQVFRGRELFRNWFEGVEIVKVWVGTRHLVGVEGQVDLVVVGHGGFAVTRTPVQRHIFSLCDVFLLILSPDRIGIHFGNVHRHVLLRNCDLSAPPVCAT
jgi:hypothetical protein